MKAPHHSAVGRKMRPSSHWNLPNSNEEENENDYAVSCVAVIALILSSMVNAQAETPDVHRHKMAAENATIPEDTLKNPFADKKRSALIGEKIFVQNCVLVMVM